MLPEILPDIHLLIMQCQSGYDKYKMDLADPTDLQFSFRLRTFDNGHLTATLLI